jgi:hypothetical protein
LELQVKELLDEYVDEIREPQRNPPGVWIFKRSPRHELYHRALVELLNDARNEGRREGAAAVGDILEDECACRCRKHDKIACPLCVDTRRCPVHSEPDPRLLEKI